MSTSPSNSQRAAEEEVMERLRPATTPGLSSSAPERSSMDEWFEVKPFIQILLLISSTSVVAHVCVIVTC